MKIELSFKTQVSIVSVIFLLIFMCPRLNAQNALKQLEQLAGTNVNVPGVPNPTRVSTSSNRTNSPSASYLRRLRVANKFNERAIHYMNTGDYRKAVSSLKKARWYNPFNQTVASNLEKAKSALQKSRQGRSYSYKPPKPKHSINDVYHRPISYDVPKPTENTSTSMRIRSRTSNNNYYQFGNMSTIQPNSGVEDNVPATYNLGDSFVYQAVGQEMSVIGNMPDGQLAGVIGKFMLKIENNSFSAVQNATNDFFADDLSKEDLHNLNPKVIINKSSEQMLEDYGIDFTMGHLTEKGIGYLNNKYGEISKTFTKLGIGTVEKTKDIYHLYKAWSNNKEQHKHN